MNDNIRQGSMPPPPGSHEMVEPVRAALLLALLDRVQHDRAFGTAFRHEPIESALAMDISLTDAEWAGLRHFLT
jgi:hypothetical protein